VNRGLRWALLAGTGAAIVIAVAAVARARHTSNVEDAGGEAAVAPPNRLQLVRGRFGDEAAIVIDEGALRRAGIATRVMASAERAPRARLTGELVADPAHTTVIRAPLAGRLASAGGHWPALGDLVQEGTVLGQVSDARPLAAPRSGTVTSVRVQPGEMVEAGQVLMELTDYARPLARIVWSDAALRAPPRLDLAPLSQQGDDHLPMVGAQLVGLAPSVDSLTRAPVYVYRLAQTWPGALPGAPVVALVPEPVGRTKGVLVPTDAVVQWQGLAWAYVQHGPGTFVRVPVDASHPTSGGWLVTSGVAAGDTVVVRGAQLLLSEEFRSRVSVGDEDQR